MKHLIRHNNTNIDLTQTFSKFLPDFCIVERLMVPLPVLSCLVSVLAEVAPGTSNWVMFISRSDIVRLTVWVCLETSFGAGAGTGSLI